MSQCQEVSSWHSTPSWQSIMRKVTWRRFDQSAKQLVVGQTTMSTVCCCFTQTETIKPLTFTPHELLYFFSETVISIAISTVSCDKQTQNAYYAEQWFEDGNNWVIDTGGRSNEVRPRIYLFVGMGRINKLESKMLCEVVTSLKFWRVCLASPRLLRQYRKF